MFPVGSNLEKNELGILIKGANITANGKSVTTDENGQASIKVKQSAKYLYEISHPKYYTRYGELSTYISDSTRSLLLEIKKELIIPVKNGNIQATIGFYGTTLTMNVSITSETSDYVIHWGDGSTNNANGEGTVGYEHTYEKNDYYQIEISNCENITDLYLSVDHLRVFWSIGNSKIASKKFGLFTRLRHIGDDVFKNDKNRTNFDQCFGNAQNLEYIPAAIFDPVDAITNATKCFNRCYRLKDIPTTFLEKLTADAIMDSCFRGDYSLTKAILPVTVTGLGSETYNGCSGLQYVIASTIVPQVISSDTFTGTNCPIYVPDESLDAYKTATNWSALAERIKSMSDFETDFPEEVIE